MKISYHEEYTRCGKEGCGTCRSGKGHGPYWYAAWREGGKVRRKYVGLKRPDDATLCPRSGDSGEDARQPSRLRIRLLGGVQVERDGKILPDSAWGRASARRLLAYLLLHPDGVHREAVAEALWPDADPGVSAAALKRALTALRSLLDGPRSARQDAQGKRLPSGQTILRLHLQPSDWVDVDQFTANPSLGDLTPNDLRELLSLWHGDPVPEYGYEDWTFAAREALRTRRRALTLLLAQRRLETHDHDTAIELLQALVTDDPTDEQATRELIRALVCRGRRTDALRVYSSLATALESDLSTAPAEESRALANELGLAGAPRPPSQSALETVERTDKIIHQLLNEEAGDERTAKLARAWADRARALCSAGEHFAALRSVERGKLALHGQDLPAESGRLLLSETLAMYLQGNPEATFRLASEAATLLQQGNEPASQVRALILKAQALEQLGHAGDALVEAQETAKVAAALHDPELALDANRVVASSTWRAGDLAQAEQLHGTNLSEARALGDAQREGYVLCGLANTERDRGELEASEAHLHAAAAIAEERNDPQFEVYIGYHLGNLWRDRAFLAAHPLPTQRPAAPATARKQTCLHFRRALELAETEDNRYMALFAALDWASAYLEWGNVPTARKLLSRAVICSKDLPNDATARAWLTLGLGSLALARGQYGDAESRLRSSITLLQEGSPTGLAEALRALGSARAGQGDPRGAGACWQASLEHTNARGQVIERYRTRVVMRGVGT